MQPSVPPVAVRRVGTLLVLLALAAAVAVILEIPRIQRLRTPQTVDYLCGWQVGERCGDSRRRPRVTEGQEVSGQIPAARRRGRPHLDGALPAIQS